MAKNFKETVIRDNGNVWRAEQLGFKNLSIGEILSLSLDLFGGEGMATAIIQYIENGFLEDYFDSGEAVRVSREFGDLKSYVAQGLAV